MEDQQTWKRSVPLADDDVSEFCVLSWTSVSLPFLPHLLPGVHFFWWKDDLGDFVRILSASLDISVWYWSLLSSSENWPHLCFTLRSLGICTKKGGSSIYFHYCIPSYEKCLDSPHADVLWSSPFPFWTIFNHTSDCWRITGVAPEA